jgi:aspartyl-tRNA(Asn)/glutamyl-tRNA(Gln) amidotransferase subunit A
MEIPLDINTLQEGLEKRIFCCTEIIDSYLERINTFDSKINSFITISDQIAYEKAKWVDKIVENYGKEAFIKYPLLGVTVAHKDLFLTKGVRTTAGSHVLESYIPEYSATVVDKLNEAGSIVIGKTNCDAWAHGASGENSDFGPTRNPWNTDFVPGGSSSGSAAALASNFCMISTGTDTGGSVRQPASFCSVVGLKPSYGSVSRYGVIAMASSLDSIGHFTRTVEDSKKIFDVTKGIDGKDATLKNLKLEKEISKKNLKIGLPYEYFVEGLASEVKEAVLSAVKIFKNMNFEIIDVHLPHTKYAISAYYIIQPAEVSSNLARYDGIRYGNGREKFSSEAKRRIMLGTFVLSSGYYEAYYMKAMKVRTKIIHDFEKAFKEVDAIIAPVSPTPPFKIGEKSNDPLKMYLADIYTSPANLSGIPAVSIPTGFNKDGLPLGFQLMAPHFSENTLFYLGKLFEKETNYQKSMAFIS